MHCLIAEFIQMDTVWVVYVCFGLSYIGIQNDVWARFVTLPNQNRIWTLTVTNKTIRKPVEQGILNSC